MSRPFNPLPTPRLNQRPSAQWERTEPTNWLLWGAILFAFAVVVVATNVELFA